MYVYIHIYMYIYIYIYGYIHIYVYMYVCAVYINIQNMDVVVSASVFSFPAVSFLAFRVTKTNKSYIHTHKYISNTRIHTLWCIRDESVCPAYFLRKKHVYNCVFVCVYEYPYTHAYIYMYIHTHTFTCIYIYSNDVVTTVVQVFSVVANLFECACACRPIIEKSHSIRHELSFCVVVSILIVLLLTLLVIFI